MPEPIRIALELTSRCDLACAMCSHPVMRRARADMPWVMFEQAVAEIIDRRHVLMRLYSFGEPLLAKHLMRALRHLREWKVQVEHSFSTNCQALTPAMTDALLDAGFVEVHCNAKRVRLCIDTLNPAIYRKLRRGGELAQAIEHARYFVRKTRGRLPVEIEVMRTRWNLDEPTEPFEALFPGAKVVAKNVGRHWDKSRDLTITPFGGDRRSACLQLWGPLWMAVDGTVTTCCMDGDLEQAIGTFPDESIEEIARGPALAAQQKAFARGDYGRLPLCARCTGDESHGL